jgi:L-fuculose-phosphate aldolase
MTVPDPASSTMGEWTEALRRAELVAVGAALSRRGLIRGREGNLSCRLDAQSILLTPRGTDKGHLSAPDLVRCWIGEPPPPRASTEALAHLAFYRRCPPAQALVHAHPRDLLTLAGRGLLPDPGTLDEGLALVPRIESVPPLPPGSEGLAEACAEALSRAPVAVVRRHGVFCAGDDIWQALERVEIVELLAGIALSEIWKGAEI